MRSIKAVFLSLSFLLAAAGVQAGDIGTGDHAALRSSFYIGAGTSRADGEFDDDSTPFSIGFMHRPGGGKLILGGDLGREGTMLDSTYRRDEFPKQATSYNLLIGGNLAESARMSLDLALLLGLREATADCPDSYLGYQCYADREPDTDYKGNYGAVLNLSFDRFTLGLRATGESTQLVSGFRF